MKRFILLIVAVIFVFVSARVSFADNTSSSGATKAPVTKSKTKTSLKVDKDSKALDTKSKTKTSPKGNKGLRSEEGEPVQGKSATKSMK